MITDTKLENLVPYIRLSKPNDSKLTQQESEDFIRLGKEVQLNAILKWAEYKGVSLLDPVVEFYTAKTGSDRKLFNELLDRCRDKEVGGIIVYKLDRFARSQKDFQNLIAEFLAKGINLVVVRGELDLSTPYGRAMAGMMMQFAELERDLISERTKSALYVKASKGWKAGRPIEHEKDLDTEIQKLRSLGLSLREIAKILNDRGTLTPRGKLWSANAISRVCQRDIEGAKYATV